MKCITGTKGKMRVKWLGVSSIDDQGNVKELSNGMKVCFIEKTSELWDLYECTNYAKNVLIWRSSLTEHIQSPSDTNS